MIQVAERIWIGDSISGENPYSNITAILNVAVDLNLKGRWPAAVYAQAGLVDGPGNSSATYVAAALLLGDLSRRRDTLVCCHNGGRSLAVVVMHLTIQTGRDWDGIMQILWERTDRKLPSVHKAHMEALKNINWHDLYTVATRE